MMFPAPLRRFYLFPLYLFLSVSGILAASEMPTNVVTGWNALSGFEKMFWFLAIPATLLFLIMSVMTFTGLGGENLDGSDGGADAGGDAGVDHGDISHDTAHDGGSFADAFHLFTVRNFIVFFMMFGWSGIAMVKSSAPPVASILVAALIGLVMMFVVSFLFYLVSRLAHSGTIATGAAVGATGTVYLTIPKNRSGSGKVTAVVGGAKVEFKAMTDGEELVTGESIKVMELIGGDVLLVEKLQ
ncbi:MAG: hypothetical protein JW863_07540 [Chitinispirillaceae bacterium]|nr:hypothetical protein [Chitinispirillaceae bacterium]